MNYSYESFMDYAYEEDIVMEAFHPIKGIQNIIMKIIAAIQKLLNRIRGLRAAYVPKMHLKTYNDLVDAFGSQDVHNAIQSKDFSKTDDLESLNYNIENSNMYTGFINIDTSIFGKDDYEQINSKDVVRTLNNTITSVTKLKTDLNKNLGGSNDANRFANEAIKFFSFVVSFYAKVLKFHPPLMDPKNVNKLGGIGAATIHV